MWNLWGLRMQSWWDGVIDRFGDDSFTLYVYGSYIYCFRNSGINTIKPAMLQTNRNEHLEHDFILDCWLTILCYGNAFMAEMADAFQSPAKCHHREEASLVGRCAASLTLIADKKRYMTF